MSLEINLQPFSLSQAFQWIDVYAFKNPSLDVASIKIALQGLDAQIKEVIMIPYILYTCTEKRIDFSGITGLGSLYDLLFAGINAVSAVTQYNYDKKPRHKTRNWKLYEETIEKLSVLFCHTENHIMSETELIALIGDESIPISQLATEFYLKKVGTSYRFVHNSIFEYFVAKKVAHYANDLLKTRDVDTFFRNMTDIIGDTKAFNLSTLEFVSHFIPRRAFGVDRINEIITIVLKKWTRIYFPTSDVDDIFRVLGKVQNRFVAVMSVFLEYLKKYGAKSNALQMLSEDEVALFVKYTQFNDRAFDFIITLEINSRQY